MPVTISPGASIARLFARQTGCSATCSNLQQCAVQSAECLRIWSLHLHRVDLMHGVKGAGPTRVSTPSLILAADGTAFCEHLLSVCGARLHLICAPSHRLPAAAAGSPGHGGAIICKWPLRHVSAITRLLTRDKGTSRGAQIVRKCRAILVSLSDQKGIMCVWYPTPKLAYGNLAVSLDFIDNYRQLHVQTSSEKLLLILSPCSHTTAIARRHKLTIPVVCCPAEVW